MHDALFQNQKALGPEQLPNLRGNLGSTERSSAMPRHGKFAADIKQDIAAGESVGISGTPRFLVGIVQPAMDA